MTKPKSPLDLFIRKYEKITREIDTTLFVEVKTLLV